MAHNDFMIVSVCASDRWHNEGSNQVLELYMDEVKLLHCFKSN